MDYDVLIVGGGIAGSVCGKLLAERGFRSAILEQKDGPFEKTCGGWMPYKSVRLLKSLGWQTDWLLANGAVMTRAVMIEQSGVNHRYPYPDEEYGLGLRRELLHRFLISGALEAGCDVHYSTPVTHVHYDGGKYRLSGHVGTRLIMAIGTGRTDDMVRTGLYLGQSFGISEWIRAQTRLHEDTVYFWYPEASSKGYFWAIPIERDVWNIGWWDTSAVGAAAAFQTAREACLRRFFREVRSVRKPRGAFCGNRSHVDALPYPVLGVGDFIGCNNPDSGEGIFYAIQSAAALCAELTGDCRIVFDSSCANGTQVSYSNLQK